MEDSSFEEIDDYFCKICNRPTWLLRKWQRGLVEAWHSRGLIENGGFHSYLCEIGPDAHKTIKAIRAIGLHSSAKLIESALNVWREFCDEQQEDFGDADDFRRKYDAELTEIETNYYELAESDATILASLIKEK